MTRDLDSIVPGLAGDGETIEPRRLSCERCRRKKLQCRFEEEEDDCCIRCRRSMAECTSKAPRQVGRPRVLSGNDSGRGRRRKQQQKRPSQPMPDTVPATSAAEQRVDTSLATSSPCDVLQGQFDTDSLEWPHASMSDVHMSGPVSCLPLSNFKNHQPTGYEVPPDFDSFDLPDYRLLDGLEPSVERSMQSAPSSLSNCQTPAAFKSPSNGRLEASKWQQTPLLPTDGSDTSFSDAKEDCMERLWNLQTSLYRQLRHVSTLCFNPNIRQSNTPLGQVLTDTPYPIVELLRSCDSFMQIIDVFERSANRTPESSISSVVSSTPSSVLNGSSNDSELADILMSNSGASELEDFIHQQTPIQGPHSRKDSQECFIEMDTPALCIILICYSRLIDIFSNFFAYLQASLRHYLSSPAALLPTLPDLQLGDFCPRNSGHIKVVVLVQVCVHMLTRVVRTLGLPDQVVAGLGCGQNDLIQPTNGVLGKSAGIKLVELMILQESKGGIDGKKRSRELRVSIDNVKRLSEQMMYL